MDEKSINVENLAVADQIQDEYWQWQKDTGKAQYKLIDVVVYDNGEITIVEKMAWIVNTSPNDWKEFCQATGKEFRTNESISFADFMF